MKTLFEHLARNGLRRTKIEQRLASWDKTKLIDFVREANELLPRDISPNSSKFSFHASSSLGGMPSPCSDIECRTNGAVRLARFAALYADSVFVQPCLATPADLEREEAASARYRLRNDLAVLYVLEPLLNSGLVKFLPRPVYCEQHWRSAFKETSVDRAERSLLGALSASVTVSLQNGK